MSLSTEARNVHSKPHGLQAFSEHHPLLLALVALAGFLAALLMASRYLYF